MQVQGQNTGILTGTAGSTGSLNRSASTTIRSAQNDLGGEADQRRTAKLVSGAHEFEAMMLGQMLKGMKFGEAPGDGGEDGEETGANGTLQSYGTEALAKSISSAGGFGIAQRIIREVTAEDAAKENSNAGSKVR